jgi:hypothetical protein
VLGSIVHEAADAGDVAALRQLLEERARALEQRRQQLVEVGPASTPIVVAGLWVPATVLSLSQLTHLSRKHSWCQRVV